MSTTSLFESQKKMNRRRLQKTGYLYEKSGCWRLRYRVDLPGTDARGNRIRQAIQRTIGISKGKGSISRREASRIAWDEYLSKLDIFLTRPGSMVTLREFVEKFFEPEHIWSLKPKGKEHYDSMLRCHVFPALGLLQLREVTRSHVQGLCKGMVEKGLSVQTAVHARNVLSAIFRHAKSKDFYSGDLPTDNIKLPQMVRKERGALKWEQVAEIVMAIPQIVNQEDKRNGPDVIRRYQALVWLLAVTGMRINEALALTWVSVSFEQKTASVEATVTKAAVRYRKDGALGTPKSQKGIRLIPLPNWIAAELDALPRQSEYVFCSHNGTPLDSHNMLSRMFKPAAQLVGLSPEVTFHWLRHTANSLMEQAGMSATERMKVIGHASETANRVYSHAEQDSIRARMDTIGKPKPTLFLVPEPAQAS